MILLARHGRTAYNDEGRFQGRGPVPLDAHGRAEAFALAEQLAERGDVTRMVSSPLTRAMETAAIVASRLGLAPEVDPRLAETDTGDWTDRTYADVIAAEGQGAYDAFRRLEPDFGAPGGETFAAQLARIVPAVEDARTAERDGDVTLLVCHGNVIRLLIGHFKGGRPTHADIANTHLEAL
ncbi:histidine phosphatase family protein [Patulibacter minatonensis]|uniref:histidine phosphatase family protein n=1 Tax=Patulibacter minatonensis TaxID=298163 RepID=UPI0004BA7CAF|nr:histidine phosphatase family protein [Patulibacter minatonensis]